MRLYLIVRALRESFLLGIFWLYVLLLVVALLCMFAFPPVTIGLFWCGLVSLPLVLIAGRMVHMLQHLLARRLLSRGHCPACGSDIMRPGEPGMEWHCGQCGYRFHAGGEETLEVESPAGPA